MQSLGLTLSHSSPSAPLSLAIALRPRAPATRLLPARSRLLRRALSSGSSPANPGPSNARDEASVGGSGPAGSKRPRVVVLGCGWAGFRFLHEIDTTKADVTCISPRNHFVFTPLLPSTTVGTLEFRCIIEPVRTLPGLRYLQADCTAIEEDNKIIHVRDDFHNADLRVPYDYLVISCGARANTFGVPGVEQHAHFLKDLHDARAIRERLLECFERASSPALNDTEKRQLLTFVCVGGGPTSIEFAGELHDFIQEDVAKWYPDLVQDYVKIVLIEATDHLLGTFDNKLSDYVMNLLKKRKIVSVLTSTQVKEVKKDQVELKSGESIPCGLVVWSTGVSSNPLIRGLIDKGWVVDKRSGRLLTDDHLRVLAPGQTPPAPSPDGSTGNPVVLSTVFAMGDCARPSGQNFPPTAQVAQQQGKYLGKLFNKHIIPSARAGDTPAFMYRHSGMLAYIGGYKALADVGSSGKLHWYGKGLSAWLFWRSAYFTKLVSLKNKMLVPMFWFKTFVFGRDISRF